jgi:4-carboxymuconolactone decarboxylase
MSRIEPVEVKGPFLRASRAIGRRQYGREMTSLGVWGHHPRLLRAYVLHDRAVEKDDRVPRRLKALAVLEAAAVVGCEFCVDIGSEYARRAGLTDEQLLALPRARESGRFSEEELLVIDYAAAMSRTPPEVTDAMVERLTARLGEKGVFELTMAIAWENLRARVNAALDVEPEGFSEGKVCVVPERMAATSG